MLEIKGLDFSYGKKPVLDRVGFRAETGRLCGLFGPNGSGKTTLFKCCLKFLPVGRGRVFLDGADVGGLPTRRMAMLAAYVPQEHSTPFAYLAKEIVLMGRTPHLKGFFGVGAEDEEKAAAAMDLLGIGHLEERCFNRLSSGQRQMVLIARAIAQETRYIFLDEPTSALDFKNQIKIWRVMRMLADKGITVVACSHDPNHVGWFCERVVVLHAGRVLAAGDPDRVMTQGVLETIYQNSCQVRRSGAVRLVLPGEVAKKCHLEKEERAKND